MSNNGAKWIRRARRLAIYERDGWRCVLCCVPLARPVAGLAPIAGTLARKRMATLDHVVPLELGGTHASRNLITACSSCNSRKRDLGPRAFAQWFARHFCEMGTARSVASRVRNAQRRRVDMRRGRELAAAELAERAAFSVVSGARHAA